MILELELNRALFCIKLNELNSINLIQRLEIIILL